MDPQVVAQLRVRCAVLHDSGILRPAKIGRGAGQHADEDVRGDFISWLEEPKLGIEYTLLERFDALRAALNRELMAGLEDFQGHFALYPPGAAYARHSDRFVGNDVRAISVALYLNDAWSQEQGGALRIYTPGDQAVDVLPEGGRLVAFQSERFEHEVLPANRERMSFAGWFRRRPLEGFV